MCAIDFVAPLGHFALQPQLSFFHLVCHAANKRESLEENRRKNSLNILLAAFVSIVNALKLE